MCYHMSDATWKKLVAASDRNKAAKIAASLQELQKRQAEHLAEQARFVAAATQLVGRVLDSPAELETV